MTSIRMKYRPGALFDIRRLPEVVARLEYEGRNRLSAANRTLSDGEDGYRMSSKQGRKNPQGRWAVRIYTASNRAKRSNARNNTLVRLLGRGE